MVANQFNCDKLFNRTIGSFLGYSEAEAAEINQ